MKIHNLDKADVFKSLATSEGGLTDAEARRRLDEYGPNLIEPVRHRPLYKKILSQFTHFLAALLWTAAALCFLSAYLHPGEGMFSLGIAITGVIFVNAAFTLVQERRAERTVDALKRLLPFMVKAVREGVVRELRSEEVLPGDVILISEGDKAPADARITESSRLMVNNAALTGEPDARLRDAAPFDGEYMDSPNIVFAGTHVVSGSARAVVFATGMSTEFGKIARLTAAVEPGLSPLQKEIIKATRVVAVIALTTGILFFGLGLAIGRGFWHNFIFAVGIIIANVPEGLLPTVTLALAMGSQRMAAKKALIKNLTSVETLGSVTVICTDKTGTLTENKMTVREVWRPATPGDADMLMTAASLCTNAAFEEGRYRGDPTETAILKQAREATGGIKAERLYEIPFDSDRKMMTTVDRVGDKAYALSKGAVESVLTRCGDETLMAEVMRSYSAMAGKGLRVIGFAYKEVQWQGAPGDGGADAALEDGLVFVGLMGLEDPPRPEVKDAVRRCLDAGIRIIMLTGDASGTALAVGREIGLTSESAVAVDGRELDSMTDEALKGRLLNGDTVFSRMTPQHKMRIVSILKDEGERVAVTGDGVNDAPALKKADIGIAMGLSGTDVAREAADMVLLDDNFATIVGAVEEGRAIFDNIRKFITYIFAHLTPEAVPYILFALFTIPLPLTVMQILAIDLGTETIPALALGVEPPGKDVMKSGPLRNRGLIDKGLLFRGYVFLGLISAAGVLSAYFYVLYAGGWEWGAALPPDGALARQASTAAFLGIVIMQVGNVFACRSGSESVFSLGLFKNRLVVVGIAAELALSALIIYHPLGNRMFGTAPVGIDVWLLLAPFSLSLLLADELWKYARRRRDAAHPS